MSLFEEASLVITPNAFKAGKLYAVKGADLDVTRATSATRVNANGVIETVASNVPRIDYSGGGCPSILVESQRTNLYTYSQELNQWSILGSITVTENDAISPDDTQNADRAQFSLNTDLLYRSGTGSAGSNTISVYAKAKSGSSQKFRFFGNGGLAYSSDQIATNEWQRFTFTYTYSTATAGLAGATTGASDVLFYGFQHEIGSYPTSYIPTTSASVTRNADVISKTGISSLIGQTEGTVFIELDIKNTIANRMLIVLSSANPGTTTSEAYFYINPSGNLVFDFYTAGVNQCSISVGAVQVGVQKLAFVYKNNDFAFYRNGTLVGNDTGGTVVSGLDRLFLGCFTNSGLQLNDRIKSAAIWKTRLGNSELATLTTI